MPQSKQWIRECIDDQPASSTSEISVMLWANLPNIGIIPGAKYDFYLTYLTNMLTDFPKNSIAIIVFPNRAAQLDKR